MGGSDIGAVGAEWDGERVGVAVHSAAAARSMAMGTRGGDDPVADIGRVARPSAEEVDDTDVLGADGNDGWYVVTMGLVSVRLRTSDRGAGIARPPCGLERWCGGKDEGRANRLERVRSWPGIEVQVGDCVLGGRREGELGDDDRSVLLLDAGKSSVWVRYITHPARLC
jgi:hypothetical protein